MEEEISFKLKQEIRKERNKPGERAEETLFVAVARERATVKAITRSVLAYRK